MKDNINFWIKPLTAPAVAALLDKFVLTSPPSWLTGIVFGLSLIVMAWEIYLLYRDRLNSRRIEAFKRMVCIETKKTASDGSTEEECRGIIDSNSALCAEAIAKM